MKKTPLFLLEFASFSMLCLVQFGTSAWAADVRNFCGQGAKNKVVVQLSQAVSGNWLQNHFIFQVNVAGHPFDVDSSSGVLNEEVAVCGAGKKIDVSVVATTKNKGSFGGGSAQVGRKAPDNWASIGLTKKASAGSNYIMVIVLDPNEYQESSQGIAGAVAASNFQAINGALETHSITHAAGGNQNARRASSESTIDSQKRAPASQ